MSDNLAGNNELFINNRYRSPDEDAYQFSLVLPYLNENVQASYGISVDAVTFENVLPVIQEGVNDLLLFEFDGVASSIEFQEGNYDIFDLIDSIKSVLILLDPAFDVVYDEKQKQLQLVTPPAHTFVLVRSEPNPFGLGKFTNTDRVDRLLEVLGWSFSQSDRLDLSAPDVTPFTWVPANVVRVFSTSFVELCVDQHLNQSYNMNPTNQDNTLARIPLLNGYGEREHYQKNNLQEFILHNAAGIRITFYIVDEWGRQRKLGMGKHGLLSFQLKLNSLGQ
jgi:hypothetical protein